MEMQSIEPVRRLNGKAMEQAGDRRRLYIVAGREDVRLTPRQLECLMWAGEGKSSVDIGGILGISSATVDGHVADACRRLGVRTRIQAIVEAYRRGWLQ